MLQKKTLFLAMTLCLCACGNSGTTVSVTNAITLQNVSRIEYTSSLVTNIGTNDLPRTLDISPDGKLLAVGYRSLTSNYVVFWDRSSWQQISKISSTEEIEHIHFSSDSRFFIIVTKQGSADLWDLTSSPYQRRASLHTSLFVINDVFDAGVNPQLNYVATASGGTLLGTSDFQGVVQIWDIKTGKENTRWTVLDGAVQVLKVSSKGHIIALGTGSGGLASLPGTIQAFDAQSGQTLLASKDFPEGITDIEFGANDSLLAASSSDGTIEIWDIAKQQRINTLHHGKNTEITDLSFGAGSTLLISAGTDGFVRIWDVAKGIEIGQLKRQGDSISAAKFSPDDLSIVVSSLVGPVTIWAAK